VDPNPIESLSCALMLDERQCFADQNSPGETTLDGALWRSLRRALAFLTRQNRLVVLHVTKKLDGEIGRQSFHQLLSLVMLMGHA